MLGTHSFKYSAYNTVNNNESFAVMNEIFKSLLTIIDVNGGKTMRHETFYSIYEL